MTIKPLPAKVDESIVHDFLDKLGLDPGDKIKQVTIIPGGIEVVQWQHTGSGMTAHISSYGWLSSSPLATVTTQIEVERHDAPRT